MEQCIRRTAWNGLHVIDGAGVLPLRLLPFCRYVLLHPIFRSEEVKYDKANFWKHYA
jgi:hypothetical protein